MLPSTDTSLVGPRPEIPLVDEFRYNSSKDFMRETFWCFANLAFSHSDIEVHVSDYKVSI